MRLFLQTDSVLRKRHIIIIIVVVVVVVTPWEFFTLAIADGPSLESEWHQISSSLQDSLADLSNAAVWMVSTLPFISKSSIPFINPMVTVPRAFSSFSHQRQQMVFHWSLSDSKSPQISRTLLSILADLNNAVV